MSDYKIIDVNERDPSGTSLKGYIQEDYSTLVQAFVSHTIKVMMVIRCSLHGN